MRRKLGFFLMIGAAAIRLNSRTATPLATVSPDTAGRISTAVTIPGGTSPGWYVILATQQNASTGVPKSGTPGRTSIRVQGAAAARNRHGGGVAATPGGPRPQPTGGSGGGAGGPP